MAATTPLTREQDTNSLTGKTCVVTGSSRGIGREIALELGRHGANVAVNFRSSRDEAQAVADSIEDMDGTACVVQADVADFEQVERLAAEVRDTFGPVDVVVNNAGITRDTTFDRMSRDEWEQVIDTNLGGVFNTTKAFYDDLKEADEGRLINIASVVGQQGNYGQANYAAAKSGLFGLTRSLAQELAPSGSTANCVAPGYTKTEMVEAVREDIQDSIREDIPLRRFATVEEIANAVRFLASDDSSYITGEILNVNGGMYS